MDEKNEKLEELLASLKERNMTIEDLKPSGEEFPEEEEDVELLDDDDDDSFDDTSIENTDSNIELEEDDSKVVDLGDFF